MQARQDIKQLNEELEQQVIERTKELAAANEVLRREIAERKQAEDVLRRSEDRTRLIIDTIPTMAWTVQPDGSVDFLNQRWMEYSGLSFDQYLKDPAGPIHPDDTARVFEKWRVSMTAGVVYDDEMRLRRADGVYRWFLVRTAPVRDEHLEMLLSGTDYPSILKIESMRKLCSTPKNRSFAPLLKTPNQIIRYDRELRRTYVNPAVTSAYGLPAEGLIGKPIGSVISDARLDVKTGELEELRQRSGVSSTRAKPPSMK